jgi:hypothetical protein
MMPQYATIFHVPDDIASLVLMFCGTDDLLNCRLVCKSWEVHAKNSVKCVVLKTNTTNAYIKNMTLYFCNQSFPNLQHVVTVDNIETVYWELPKCKHLKSINHHVSLRYGSRKGFYPQEITDLKIAAKFFKRFPKYESFFVRCTIDEAYTIVSKLKKNFIKKLQICHQKSSIVNHDTFFKCFPLLTELHAIRFEYLEVSSSSYENNYFGFGVIEFAKTKNPDIIIHYNKEL